MTVLTPGGECTSATQHMDRMRSASNVTNSVYVQHTGWGSGVLNTQLRVIFLFEFKLEHPAQQAAKTLTVYLEQDWRMNAPFAVALSNFIPVTQHCKMSPMGTD